MAHQYVIIGSGIAGLSAAEAIRQHEAAADITLIAEEAHGFYSRPGLAYYLRGDIPEKQLFNRSHDDLQALGLHWLKSRAEKILPAAHQVLLANGQSVTYDRLLLATGSTTVSPDFPGGELSGVVKLDKLDDARHILKLSRRGRTAVVIGGGITALEIVEGLRERGVRVHYFLRGERYWSNVLDETESGIVTERLQAEGVIIHAHTHIKQALGKNGKLIGVETQSGERINCQILAVAIGVRPRLELARSAELKIDRGVLVDEFMRTSAPDIFAAGDVAQAYDPRSGRAVLDVLWSTAIAQGRAAGANMAGVSQAYTKEVAFNVTQLAGLSTSIIGAVGSGHDDDLVTISRGDSEAWRLLSDAWVVAEREDVNRVRVLVGEQSIVGAFVLGDQTWSRPLYQLIAAQVDIRSIRAAMMDDTTEAMTYLTNFYQEWEQHHAPQNV